MPATPQVVRVTAEHATDRTTVATARPRISWVTECATPGWWQASAEVELTGPAGTRTAVLEGEDSVLVGWPFEDLRPREEHALRVRVTGRDGSVSGWSEPRPVVAGFLADGEWSAATVGLADPAGPAQPVLLRRGFTLDAPVRRAWLYATAQGVYQVEVNGREVDDEVLKPGWTAYDHRLLHESTDVTGLLTAGENAVGVRLAGGWFCETFPLDRMGTRRYGEQPAAALQLVVELADGTTRTITTDGDWRATGEGPLRRSGIYPGETFDARRALPGWSSPGFDDSAWAPVRVDGPCPVPEARLSPGARRLREVPVAEVLTTPSGRTVLDFGEDLVGWVRFTVSGPAGATVTLRHAEVLEDGELCTRPLRSAEATDRYVLAGTGRETWEPWSTFHGFRYAEVDGWPGDLDPADVVAVVVSSDLRRTGWFECSHELLSRFHDNVVRGTVGNFLHLPTDCPQRDERLGWTGDIQVFAPTASALLDCDGFLTSWLRDLALEQADHDGVVPYVVPSVRPHVVPAAAWGDAATVVPAVLHERFGDTGVLAAQYASMRAWVDVELAAAGERRLWEGGFQFGDWLDPAAPPDRPGEARTDPDLVATAELFRSADLLARTARLLGREEDAGRYGDAAEEVRRAWLREHVTPAGRVVGDTQTAYALAIRYGIVTDPEVRAALGGRLAHLVRAAGYRVATGFVGTPLVCDALTATGHDEAAARLLLQTECPSWLYPVTMGATTVWERWDSLLEDGSVNPGQMTSFNHYAFGAVADWLHRVVAGLAPAAPGYRRIEVAPHPLPGLDSARFVHDTPYGRAEAGWRREDGELVVTAVVPTGTTARVRLPWAREEVLDVVSGRHEWRGADPGVGPAPRGPVTLASSPADVLDHPAAYAALMATLRAHDEDLARAVRDQTRWVPRGRLADVLRRVPLPVQQRADEAVRAATS
ncbi:alpha-L-rhamnosidase [Kineococcus terrestris]|uniref:alpha-L-rhamnosidase n=1 Tax=Kineococcus terrestris TaxID=2044856 RepID=UPI0034DB299E